MIRLILLCMVFTGLAPWIAMAQDDDPPPISEPSEPLETPDDSPKPTIEAPPDDGEGASDFND